MASFNARTTGDQVVTTFKSEAQDKTVLITGPSEGGIGAQTAILLAAGFPRKLILAGRNKRKIQPVMDQISNDHPEVTVSFVEVDLAVLSSVRHAAEVINSEIDKLDILINNAGVMAIKDYTTTPEGIEMQFAANYVGHFLLTNLLMPKIFASGKGARIINVASGAYTLSSVRFDDWNFKNGKEYNPWLAYGQSKTANILFASALAGRLKQKGVLAFSVEPGFILETKLQTHISPEMFNDGKTIAEKAFPGASSILEPKSLAEGSSTSLYAALAPSLRDHSGVFLHNCAIYPEELKKHATGLENQDKLWILSERLVGQHFVYLSN